MIEKRIKIFLSLGIILGILFFLGFEVVTFADSDNDGIADSIDNCITIPNNDQLDFDLDTTGDICDNDDDNDNVIDVVDAFDTDPNEWVDYDFDELGSIQDPDDDNDGVLDPYDPTPQPVSEQLATKYLETIQSCAILDTGSANLLCYGNLFYAIVENEENNLDALELSIALAKHGTIDDCHFVSHAIGHAVYQENSNIIPNLIEVDGSLCRGGYFHGILSSYFHDIKEKNESFPDSYKIICDELIGSSNYQDCIHGMGHGFVHYYLDDLESSVEKCHGMSFYQNILCIKGVMMQYTDNKITQYGLTEQNLSDICSKLDLNDLDFQQCAMSIGSTLAFHTRHDLEQAPKSCELITDAEGRSFCHEGLRLEIDDSKKYLAAPLTQEIREKFQPQIINLNSKEWFIDLVSPAIISNFVYDPELKLIGFSFDKASYITMYIPTELMNKKNIIAINGEIQKNVILKNISANGNYAVIQVVSDDSGILQIIGIEQ